MKILKMFFCAIVIMGCLNVFGSPRQCGYCGATRELNYTDLNYNSKYCSLHCQKEGRKIEEEKIQAQRESLKAMGVDVDGMERKMTNLYSQMLGAAFGTSQSQNNNQKRTAQPRQQKAAPKTQKTGITFDKAIELSKRRILLFTQNRSKVNFYTGSRKKFRVPKVALDSDIKGIGWGKRFVKNNIIFFTVKYKNELGEWLPLQYQFALVYEGNHMYIVDIIEYLGNSEMGDGINFETGKFERDAKVVTK